MIGKDRICKSWRSSNGLPVQRPVLNYKKAVHSLEQNFSDSVKIDIYVASVSATIDPLLRRTLVRLAILLSTV